MKRAIELPMRGTGDRGDNVNFGEDKAVLKDELYFRQEDTFCLISNASKSSLNRRQALVS